MFIYSELSVVETIHQKSQKFNERMMVMMINEGKQKAGEM